jgi:hypothetical protein
MMMFYQLLFFGGRPIATPLSLIRCINSFKINAIAVDFKYDAVLKAGKPQLHL